MIMLVFSEQVHHTLEERLKNPHSSEYKILCTMAMDRIQKVEAQFQNKSPFR